MQDRLKFRIWHETLKQMHYNDFIITATGYTAKLYQENDYMMKFNQEDLEFDKQCVVMQCTGLKDKNGRLIYEGDIVNVKIDGWKTSYIPMVVVWDRKEWQLKQYNKNFKKNCSACKVKIKQKCQYCSQYFSATAHTNFKDFYNNEVIGNIYENKELLNEI